MRRLTHYDYWQDRVRKSILCDSGADMILYGMGEKNTVAVCEALAEAEEDNSTKGYSADGLSE